MNNLKLVTKEQRTANSSSNGAPFMVDENYSGRSMCRLHRKVIVNSSAAHCVATAHVMRNFAKTT
ncbi:MAG: hypothetical protein Q8K98_04595 [Bacteroidota bacterium]|nr:hypothetical protein [Bacteroidota bacterium]